jgi:membrane associated rhomboid family serine protease
MFPIRDHNPSGTTPFVCYALIVANALIFLGYWLTLTNEYALGEFLFTWGLVPARVMQGQGYATILTSMFLHGGWMHIIGNMLFLFIFGDNLEDQMGHIPFLFFYLLAGCAAAALQIIADPASHVPMVGASGAIAGVMGAYLLMFPKARVDVLIFIVVFVRVFPIPAWIVLGLWIGIQVVSGAVTPTDGGGVAYWAHVGGFAAGLILAVPLWVRRGAAGFWNLTHGTPPHPDAAYEVTKSRIPTVRRMR